MVSSRSRCPSNIWMVRRSAPASSRCVAKQCLSVCGCTSFWRPARWAAFLQASQTTLVVIGVSPVCQRLPGNSHALGLRGNPRQCSRSAASSFGLSITSRSLRPLPPWTEDLLVTRQYPHHIAIVHLHAREASAAERLRSSRLLASNRSIIASAFIRTCSLRLLLTFDIKEPSLLSGVDTNGTRSISPRSSPRDSRSSDPASTPLGGDAWMGGFRAHSANFTGRLAGEPGLTLSRTPPP